MASLTDSPAGRDLLNDLNRDLVAEMAPEELDMFGELMSEYYADPSPPNPDEQAADDPLGFGLGETIIAVTPASAAVLTAVIHLIMQISQHMAFDEVSDQLRVRIKSLFKKRPKDEPPPPDAPKLSADDLARVRQVAIDEAKRFGLPEERAILMGDVLYRRLSLGE
ncbi:MAG: hypothetical protein GYB68_19030 [Chloroflexi bacterium]|nr:hypothetical protein [Chloroflexota bacterium]